MTNSTKEHYWAKSHNMTNTRIYAIWRDMNYRCSNPNARNYKYYGARGITVCNEWKNDFITFYHWATTHGYNMDLTIDRIDNDGNYEPDNCRWSTKSVQNMSMRHKNTSGYIGISKHALVDKWYGRIKVDGKCYYTGISEDILDAVKMRNDFIIKNHLPNVLNEVTV